MNKTVQESPFLVDFVKIPFSHILFVFLIMQVSHPIEIVGWIPAFTTAFEFLWQINYIFPLVLCRL